MAERAKQPGRASRRKPNAAETAQPARLSVWNAENQQVREVALSPDVFRVPVNQHLIYEAVKHSRAEARRGTHKTKNRAEVSGSGRKPWRQKGTGRARVGEARTPLWRHGGTVFGPQPRDYSFRLPKKARQAALRSALSQRLAEGALKIVEAFPIEAPKQGERQRLTRQLAAILERLEVTGKAVLVDHQPSDALVLSGRNLPTVRVIDESYISVYDILDCQTLLVTPAALDKLEERLSP
jgi:large subunit ribosomal protein L4